MVATLVACTLGSPTGARAQAGDGAEARFRIALTELAESRSLPGITAAVVLPSGEVWSAAAGWADVEAQEAMTTRHVMPAGSIGKSFVAATAMALVLEGRVDLDSPISEWLRHRPWFDRLPNAEELTLRLLLNHSSGIDADYLAHESIESAFARSIDQFGGQDLADQGVGHEDFAEAIADSEPGFAPGTGFRYSDSAYIIAALTIEAVTGRTYYEEVTERFLKPLALASIAPQSRRMVDLAAGYEPDETRLSVFPPKLAEGGRLILDPAIEWAGGGFAATARDLARWAWFLYSGRALDGRYVDELVGSANPHTPTESGYQYGLGVQVVASSDIGSRLQHGGYFFGYSSFMEYVPRFGVSLAFQSNTKRGYSEYRGWADILWRALRLEDGAAARSAQTQPARHPNGRSPGPERRPDRRR